MTSHRRTYIFAGAVAVAVIAAAATATLVRSGGTDAYSCSTRGHAVLPPDHPKDFVTRDGSGLRLAGAPWRFSGVNMYWLGLDDNVTDSGGPTYPTKAVVDNGLCAAADLGARVVRSISLGVSVGSPRSLEPGLGQFNDKAFASIDYAVARARHYGLRLMIPLTDQSHYYSGGKHVFTNWLGHPDIAGQTASSSAAQQAQEANFYTDPKVIDAFHAYVTHLLEHRNPLTGIRLGDDPTIAIWETGNEIYDAPTAWTAQTATFIKSLAPHALVADGSAASGKDVTQTGVDASDVDIVDAHFYPIDAQKALSDAGYVAGKGKAFVVGEYPLTGTGLTGWLSSLAGDPMVSGDLAWSLLPYSATGNPEPHDDGYTFHYPGASAAEKRQTAALAAHSRAVAR